jgi:hypothetical protein
VARSSHGVRAAVSAAATGLVQALGATLSFFAAPPSNGLGCCCGVSQSCYGGRRDSTGTSYGQGSGLPATRPRMWSKTEVAVSAGTPDLGPASGSGDPKAWGGSHNGGARASRLLVAKVDNNEGGCQGHRRRSATASTCGSVTRAVESGPALCAARSEGVTADTAVWLLRAAGGRCLSEGASVGRQDNGGGSVGWQGGSTSWLDDSC